jgi:hypothetical protein
MNEKLRTSEEEEGWIERTTVGGVGGYSNDELPGSEKKVIEGCLLRFISCAIRGERHTIIQPAG